MKEKLEIPHRQLPPERLALRKEHLMAELSLQDRAARRRRRRLGLVALPAAVLLLGATGFATYALTREPTHLESVGCYDKASLDANVAVVSADGRDPIAVCDRVWQAGDLPGAPVPARLAACVLETGAIGVFPSSDARTCSKLGLAGLPASYAAEGRRFAALRDAIVARVGEPASGSSRGGPQCVGEDQALAIVRRELDSHGYADWKVSVAGASFSPARPCADVSFDTAAKAVFIVPVSRR